MTVDRLKRATRGINQALSTQMRLSGKKNDLVRSPSSSSELLPPLTDAMSTVHGPARHARDRVRQAGQDPLLHLPSLHLRSQTLVSTRNT